ncbi:glycosyltransferase family 15 protein [Schizophyllum amplum]|uniref:Glycosyltransferase family 15 protein n=1 Tax=Schizophyllum amplum TaxID=97359 RepID=A0A550CPQ5_9AGAR|nr:glycosyltransferase family 15 protein [Auriculariopsis ampla]
MHTSARYVLLALAILVSLHYILSSTHEAYGNATSFSSLTSHFKGQPVEHVLVPEEYYDSTANASRAEFAPGERASATFVILARNSDLDNTIRSVRDVEDRFNRKYNYPYVFLNDEPFSEEFKTRISNIVSGTAEFGLVPREHWVQPDWIDEDKASAARKKMEENNIIYGGSLSYRNMCRYNSGFFFRHPLLDKYRWYWRIEPDVHFHCDLDFDPFVYMQENKKVYAFTIAMYEFEATIASLWSTVKDFIKLHPEHVAQDNAMGFLSDNNGDTYNLCHFWSNFEIADLEFWRGPAYTAFFDFLDRTGGFYYERWGDAPVHSIAAALFAKREQLQFFDEIGYEHNPYTHCPQSEDVWKRGKCACDRKRSFDYDGYSCMRQWDRIQG